MLKPLSNPKEQKVPKLTEQQERVYTLMVDPKIHLSKVTEPGQLPYSVAIERRKLALAEANYREEYNAFLEKFLKDKSNVPLEMFDDSTFETKTLEDFWKSANTHNEQKSLYCECMCDQWLEGNIVGIDGEMLTIVCQKKKYLIHQIYVFIWGEDPFIHLQRMENAYYQRLQYVQLRSFNNFVSKMPVASLKGLSSGVFSEIQQLSIPEQPAAQVKSLVVETYDAIQNKVVQLQLENQMEDVQNNFREAENRVIFEEMLERNYHFVEELNLELAMEHLIEKKCDLFYNLQKQEKIYKSLITPATRDEFLPSNCEFDDAGQPIIKEDELLVNVGIWLAQNFKQCYQELQNESIFTLKQLVRAIECVHQNCCQLLQTVILPQFIEKSSLDANQYAYFETNLFIIQQINSDPVLPLSCKTLNIEDYKTAELAHQKSLRSSLETWLGEIRNGISDELIDLQIQIKQSIERIELLEANESNSGYKHLAQPQLSKELITFGKQFEIEVKDLNIYNQMQLKRFLKRVQLQIEDTIRYLVENSTEEFVHLIHEHAQWDVETLSTENVISKHQENTPFDDNGEINVCCYRAPIFSIAISIEQAAATMEERNYLEKFESQYIYNVTCFNANQKLKITDEEDSDENTTVAESSVINEETYQSVEDELIINQFEFVTNLSEFKTVLLSIFDSGLDAVRQIPEIEEILLRNIVKEEKAFAKTPDSTEPQFLNDRVALETDTNEIIEPLNTYLQEFVKYRDLLILDEEKWASTIRYKAELYLKEQLESQGQTITVPSQTVSPTMQAAIDAATSLSPNDLRNIVYQKELEGRKILAEIPDQIHVGAFLVNNAAVRHYLLSKCERLGELVQEILQDIAGQKAAQIEQLFSAIQKRLQKKSNSIEDACKLEEFICTKTEKLIQVVKQNIATMNEYHVVLDELFVQQTEGSINERWKTISYPMELKKLIDTTAKLVELDKVKFRDLQSEEQSSMAKQIDNLQKQVNTLAIRFKSLEEYQQAAEEVESMNSQLKKITEKSELYNKRELLMGVQQTDYTLLEQIERDFEPQLLLWKTISTFRELALRVYNDDFKLINGSETEKLIDTMQKNIQKALRSVKDTQPVVKELAEAVKREIADFRRFIPLLKALRNPGLRRRHWSRISEETGEYLNNLKYINGIEVQKFGEEGQEDSDTDYASMAPEQLEALNNKPVNFTFRQAIDNLHLNEMKNFDIIQKISDAASKEYAIEQVLSELEKTWKSISFSLIEYQNSGCYILRQLDDIIQKLDDDVVMIQSMMFSPFKKYFEKAINEWEMNLSSTSEIIETWILVQESWLYLEPIFSSPDIVRQLPTESKLFRSCDSFFRAHMAKTYKNPNVIQICTETHKLLLNLEENEQALEKVQKGLADYLETKRIAFPRFFFLSDDELLSILSNTKNPTAVEPFLRSCFENVARIKFVEDKDFEMQSMTSHEGEVVEFVEPLVPQGNVESWMGMLEKLILRTVQVRIRQTLTKYISMVGKNGIEGRANWVKSGFAQGIIVCNQILFCNDTDFAISGQYLEEYKEHLDAQLNQMTELVRGGLNKLESSVFSALLTYDVFERDKVQNLIDEKVMNISDFNWLKHPKHVCNIPELYEQPIHGVNNNYYGGKESAEEYQTQLDGLIDKANQIEEFLISFQEILSTLPYAFEYLGNTDRLVITPLTLKIYSTISESQAMFRFCSCSGPAGSGKTTTAEQVTNKEFGLVNIVFNCSEGLDLIGIKRMLSGVISTGGCLVMDEINRLSLDVLSVFAQMIMGIQRGLEMCGGSVVRPIASGKPIAEIETVKYVFEQTELNLNSTMCVIITQNPNYTGRQKLPANLVALFRAVSVMIPDYMKICQIRLYSYGFKKATSLAQKSVEVFKLCSEQLSQETFYDYGMRAIISTIEAAGNIREQLGQLCVQEVSEIPTVINEKGEEVMDSTYYTEDQILLRAITQVNMPKFLENDAVLFNNIVKDLFPSVKQPHVDYSTLIDELNEVLRSNTMKYLQPEDAYINKIVDLFMTINLRHGLMTLGAANSGKTQSIYALEQALNRLNAALVEEKTQKFIKLTKSQPQLSVAQAMQQIGEEYVYQRMNISRLDPMSITMDQLFGQFDPISKEWQDGVLSTLVRNAVADYGKHQQWYEQSLIRPIYNGGELLVSDVNPAVCVQKANATRQVVLISGFISTNWIESMNSVLDASKRLCLVSGEIIALSPVMNLLFNTDSVDEASPATISRLGMLYFTTLNINSVGTTSEQLGQIITQGTIEPDAYIQSWIDNLPDQLRLDDYNAEEEGKITQKQLFKSKYSMAEKLSEMALRFKELLNEFLVESIAYVKANCTLLQHEVDASLIQSLFKLLNTFIDEVKPNDFGIIEQWQIAVFMRYLEPIFFFALIWSVGAILADEQSRLMFDGWLRGKINELGYLTDCSIPEQINDKYATVFDFEFTYDSYAEIQDKIMAENMDLRNLENLAYSASIQCEWVPWSAEINGINLDELMLKGIKSKFPLQCLSLSELIVPTANNIEEGALLRRLLINNNPTLVVGNTGTGKTAVIKNYLLKHETDTKIISPLFLTLSANTEAGTIQSYLDAKIEKRRRGIYGPAAGKKFILFADDLNLPVKSKYGCISSHEFLRQLIAQGGYYDLKDIQFKNIVDTTLLAAMGPSGGSRSPVTHRLLRHFNILNFLDLNEIQLLNIFDQIVVWWAGRQFGSVSEEIELPLLQMCKKIVPMGIEIYNQTRKGLLPTPEKTHYTFNLRDLSKLFEGFLMVSPKSITEVEQEQTITVKEATNNILSLFIHECERTFADRLINAEDQQWFNELLNKTLISKISMSVSDIISDEDPSDLMFSEFTSQGYDKFYVQNRNFDEIQTILIKELNKYNEEQSSMNLVLFKSAVHHLMRISRVLRQESSNMLLIGLGGVGRESLARLASFMLGYNIKTIDLKKGYNIEDWHEDIKAIVMSAGLEGKQQVFLISDAHIFSDQELEDISILLNTCDMQFIYEQADMNQIYDEASVSQICMENQLPVTKPNLYDTFCSRVKENIHIVLCFSPSGSTLRDRIRKFPALVNCCSIDYVFNWPMDALKDVGNQIYNFTQSSELDGFLKQNEIQFLQSFLQEYCQMNTELSIEQIQAKIIDFCVFVHHSIEDYSRKYQKEQKRYNCVTPTLYLNLLRLVVFILQKNYNKINSYKQQLSNGLFKLKETEEKVTQMQKDLTELQPILVKTSKEVDELMVQLEEDKQSADQTKQVVAREKQVASSKYNECEAIKQDAERDLAEAQPLLDSALEALSQLDKKDFTELASYPKPPLAVKQCMESICILLNVKPKKLPDPNSAGKFIDEYWDESKKVLVKSDILMQNLKNYDKGHIPEETIKKLTKYVNDPEFIPQQMQKKSLAAAGLCAFVIAMYKYYHINLQVIPKREKLAEAEAELKIVEDNLNETIARLNEVEAKIQDLENKYNAAVEQKDELSLQVEDTAKRLERAQTLIVSLSGEQVRWREQLVGLDKDLRNLLGDNLFGAAAVVYLGAFTSDFREQVSERWLCELRDLGISTSGAGASGDLKVTNVLSDDVTIMTYINQHGLPPDQHSKENAAYMFTSQKYCLLIDPEQQAQAFIKSYYKEAGLEVAKATDKDLLRTLENCVRFGKVLLIINVTEEIDPSLNTVLEQEFVKDGAGQLCIKLGDSAIPYNSAFKLFLCTHLANPNYAPEQFVKVTVINFALTISGLEDQLLGVLVAAERPDQEALKTSLVVQNSKMRFELKELSAKVLTLLSTSTGDILQNEQLIETLSLSQKTSQEIQEKVKESEQTEAQIDKTRQLYTPVATRAALLYFCVQDLQQIEFMYQYSLNWYIQLYNQAIADTEQSEKLDTRLANLTSHFTLYLYQNICRSLFESHKPLFAFLVSLRILLSEKQVTTKEMKYLLIGTQSSKASQQNPCAEWLDEQKWCGICELETVDQKFANFTLSFNDANEQAQWRLIFESQKPEEQQLPGQLEAKLSLFQKFIVISLLRPDRVIAYMRIFIAKTLGQEFNQPEGFNLEKSYKDSTSTEPILFLLGDMADPMQDLMLFAEQMRMDRKTEVLSLGRGIEKAALNLVTTFAERGNYAILQNCHLSTGFLKQLEVTLEGIESDPAQISRDFRLFLTSQPTKEFPVSILENSVKVAVENPNSLKANMLRVWETVISEKQLNESCKLPTNIETYKKLTYSLSVFYSVLLQRKKYGAIGFNTPYPWSVSDVGLCIEQLPIFLDKYPDFYPKAAFEYLFAEINIGGCVTDSIDERCVNALIEDFLRPEIMKENWVFCSAEVKDQTTPDYLMAQLFNAMDYRDYLQYIENSIPIECHPNNLGLNTNSNITSDRQDSAQILGNILTMQSSKFEDNSVKEKDNEEPERSEEDFIQSILNQIPKQFDLDAISLKYPTRFEESLNSLLVEECGRYNVLLGTIDLELHELIKALQGLTIMSTDLEQIQSSLQLNKLPDEFAKHSYPSLKPFSSYLEDLNQRILFFTNWVENGNPGIFNINAFFFTEGYLTSVLENYARKYSIAIDTIGFNFNIQPALIDDNKYIAAKNQLAESLIIKGSTSFRPDVLSDGSYISGLYLEAAIFELENMILEESRPRELYCKMPIIELMPIQKNSPDAEDLEKDTNLYSCPCYRTLDRFGMLSTTGHSTNFLLNVGLPCQEGTANHWIKRSVALFTSLKD